MTVRRLSEVTAFSEFVNASTGRLFRTAYALIGDRQLAQDLLQEALVKTYLAWPRLREESRAEAYARRTIVTTLISWRRRRSFHERPVESLPEITVEDDKGRLAAQDDLWAQIRLLPPRQRVAVILRYCEDLTEAQTADLIGCSVGTVKRQVRSGLAKLRERMGADAGLPPVGGGGDPVNASVRDIKGRVDHVEVPQLDVADLIESGERKLRRRRLTTVAGAAAVILAVGVGLATWPNQTTDSPEPVDQPSSGPRPAVDRPLTFAVGSTIHYGGQTIDVEQEVHMVDVTDDGVVFVRQAPDTNQYEQPRQKALWFTDGSQIVRIGTVFGSPARGYGVTTSDAGSTLAWRDGQTVVFDTDSMRVLTRVPNVLRVYDDTVYWSADDAPCADRDGPSFGEVVVSCSPFEGMMRYDVEAGASEPVSWAAYQADANSRPRTIGSRAGDGGTEPRSLIDLDLDREGTELLTSNRAGEGTPEFTDARTGKPIRLQVPVEATTATYFQASHWLDDDSFVLFGYTGNRTELADQGDILACALSTNTCRLVLRGQPGTAYQLPRLD